MKILEHPQFRCRLAQLSAKSDLFWLVGSLTGLGLTLLAAFLPSSTMSELGTFWVYASLLVRSSLYLGAKDWLGDRGGEALSRLFAMGLVAGAFELLVDWWLVHGVSHGQLIYLGKHDVVLLASPIWMPVAWACVIVELGYPALRLYGRLAPRISSAKAAVISSAMIGISAGIVVGLYELFAYRAGWWRYEPANAMLGEHCALFIPLGECLMFFTILPLGARVLAEEEKPRAAALRSGILFAIAIAAGYGLAYLALEAR